MEEHQGDQGYANGLRPETDPPVVPPCPNCAKRAGEYAAAVKRVRRQGFADGLQAGSAYRTAHAQGYKTGHAAGAGDLRDEHWRTGYLAGHHAAMDEVTTAAEHVPPRVALGYLHDYHWAELRAALEGGKQPPGWRTKKGLRVADYKDDLDTTSALPA